jgi:hypothetical protein
VLFEEIISAYTILVGNPEGNRPFCENKTYTIGHYKKCVFNYMVNNVDGIQCCSDKEGGGLF